MDVKKETDRSSDIKSYVLRKGKMSKGQHFAYEHYFDTYCIPYKKDSDIRTETGWDACPLIIEIGFGMGHATEEIACTFPEKKFIGIEVHKPGIGRLLKRIHDNDIGNLRIIPHDAVQVLENMTAANSLDGVHIFFPDPWPKKRHHKRRLIKPQFLELAADKLKPGGYIYAVTDWEEYGLSILESFQNSTRFVNPSGGFCPGMEWRPRTKFEGKGLDKNHRIFEIYCTKM